MTATPTLSEPIFERLKMLQADHAPDGWPAVQMRDITALCEEIAMLRAENARLLADAAQWLPIESAPRDGRRVLVWIDEPHLKACAFAKLWFYSTDGRLGGGAEGFNGAWNITHWMPLPPPPQ